MSRPMLTCSVDIFFCKVDTLLTESPNGRYITRMTRPRFQFRLSTLFWLTFSAACFFAGMRAERWRAEPRHPVLVPQRFVPGPEK